MNKPLPKEEKELYEYWNPGRIDYPGSDIKLFFYAFNFPFEPPKTEFSIYIPHKEDMPPNQLFCKPDQPRFREILDRLFLDDLLDEYNQERYLQSHFDEYQGVKEDFLVYTLVLIKRELELIYNREKYEVGVEPAHKGYYIEKQIKFETAVSWLENKKNDLKNLKSSDADDEEEDEGVGIRQLKNRYYLVQKLGILDSDIYKNIPSNKGKQRFISFLLNCHFRSAKKLFNGSRELSDKEKLNIDLYLKDI